MPGANPGILHTYTTRSDDLTGLVAFEHASPGSHTDQRKHVLIFISGLTEGLVTLKYPTALSKSSSLPSDWSIVEVMLSSSYKAWGLQSLATDVSELAQCISYFRQIKPAGSKIVLMGHSTGCQDVVAYLSQGDHLSRPGIDGAILQGSVSDREAMEFTMDKKALEESISVAQAFVARGEGDEVLPQRLTRGFLNCRCTAYRWLSLASPNHDGDDDFFSSDLSPAQLATTFGVIGQKKVPLAILYSGSDETVPPYVDKQQLVDRFIKATIATGGTVDEQVSGVVPDACHNYENGVNVDALLSRVISFLSRL